MADVTIEGVPLTTVLVAIAGPLGVTLGWWLARRSETERALREERRLAYTEFIRAILEFRSAAPEKRREIRNDRWAALAALVLLAPPSVFQASWRLLSAQEGLLDDLDEDALKSVQDEVWAGFSQFASLARADLGALDNPFGQLRPSTARSGPPVLDLKGPPASKDEPGSPVGHAN
jgi:hypothetical protein